MTNPPASADLRSGDPRPLDRDVHQGSRRTSFATALEIRAGAPDVGTTEAGNVFQVTRARCAARVGSDRRLEQRMYESLLTYPGGLFGDFERLRRDFDGAFAGLGLPTSIRAVARGAYPAINIAGTPKSIEILAFAPGLDRDKLEVSVDKGLLTIAGERPVERGADDSTAQRYANERFGGRFKRVVSLPEDADTTRVEARYADGVLRISVMRREDTLPQRIRIQ
jgi:HSP20 family protein